MSLFEAVTAGLHPLEIGALGDWEGLEVAAQAVEAEFDGAEPRPVAAAIDARTAGFDPICGGDREMDAAAEIDAVGAIIDLESTPLERGWRRSPGAWSAAATLQIGPG